MLQDLGMEEKFPSWIGGETLAFPKIFIMRKTSKQLKGQICSRNNQYSGRVWVINAAGIDKFCQTTVFLPTCDIVLAKGDPEQESSMIRCDSLQQILVGYDISVRVLQRNKQCKIHVWLYKGFIREAYRNTSRSVLEAVCWIRVENPNGWLKVWKLITGCHWCESVWKGKRVCTGRLKTLEPMSKGNSKTRAPPKRSMFPSSSLLYSNLATRLLAGVIHIWSGFSLFSLLAYMSINHRHAHHSASLVGSSYLNWHITINNAHKKYIGKGQDERRKKS